MMMAKDPANLLCVFQSYPSGEGMNGFSSLLVWCLTQMIVGREGLLLISQSLSQCSAVEVRRHTGGLSANKVFFKLPQNRCGECLMGLRPT